MLASCSFDASKAGGNRATQPILSATIQSTPVSTSVPMLTEPIETTAAPAPSLPPPAESKDTFVRVSDYIPDIIVDLKYAGADNFTGEVIYASGDAWLRYGTVEKLMRVQQELKEIGYGLKLWDGFRPPSAQFKLWEICPNHTYVSNPNKGFSNHSRGNTVDITLVDQDGVEIEMPTGFDDFSAKADRDYSDCNETAADNSRLLEQIMVKHGFKGYYGEWWHYTDTDSYEVEHDFIP